MGFEQNLFKQTANFAWLSSRVQWFWLFFTFWGITTHPWHPKGPRIWKLANKNFQLHPWPAEIFGKNRKMRFFSMISKFNLCFIYGILNTHTKFYVSKSKTVVTREWSWQGSKFILLQNLRSKFYLTKIFLKNSFWRHLPSTMFWQCILSP